MRTWFRFVLAHRAAVLVVVGLITALAVASAARGVFASSIGRLFLGESPGWQRFLERADRFGGDETIIIGFDAPDLLSVEMRGRIGRVADRIAEWPEVERVLTALDARRIEFRGGGLRVEPYAEDIEALDDDPAARAALLEEMRRDPFVGATLLARDGPGTAVVVELTQEGDRAAEQGPKLIARVHEAFAAEGFARDDLHTVGQIAAVAALVEQSEIAIYRVLPLTAVALLIAVWLLFHRLWPALLAGGVSLVAVVWTLGLSVQLDPQISIMMAMVPAVILIVAFSDIVHLASAYLIELSHGKDKTDAIMASAEDVGRACFFTSLTTFVGFVSLSFIPTPVFRLTGVVLGFGVAVALLIAMTVVPILFSYFPAPAPLRTGATRGAQRGVDALLGALRRLAIGRPWLVIAGFGVCIAAAGIASAGFRVETDIVARMGADDPLRRSVDWFEARFAGTNIVDVYVEAPEPGGLLDGDRFTRLAKWQAALEGEAIIDDAQSFVDLMGVLHRALTADVPEAGPLPTTRPQLAQYLLLFEMAGGEGLDQIIDFDRQLMRVRLRLGGNGFRQSEDAGDAAVRLAAEHLADSATVEPTGMSYLLGDWLDSIIAGQRRGLGVSVGTIALMMIVALRAFGAGLWSMIPNLFPLLMLTGWAGLYDTIDSDIFLVLIIAVGIGVDDTVHFLVRLRSETARTASRREALDRTFDFAGRAIVMTTIILTAGFLPFASSDYFTTQILGTLLPACLVLALLADLLLVPAMAAVGWIRFGGAKSSGG